MREIFEFCELCDAPLDADNCYGEEDFPLCRFHHDKLGIGLAFLTEIGGNERKSQQLSFLTADDDTDY